MLPSLARLSVLGRYDGACRPCASTGETYDSIRDVLPEELIEGGQGEAPEWVWKNSRTDEYKLNKFQDYEDSDDENNTCPICSAPLDEPSAQAGSDVSRANKMAIEVLQEKNPECGHVFHRECLRKWVVQGQGANRQSCPVCRVRIADDVLESFGHLAVNTEVEVEVVEVETEDETHYEEPLPTNLQDWYSPPSPLYSPTSP